MMTAVLFGGLVALLIVGMPITFAIALATLGSIIAQGLPSIVVVQKLLNGVDSYPLIAIPFFILAAELMTGGSLAMALLRFASVFVGHRRGGLGYTTIITLTLFSGISGSALADAAGPGALLMRMMRNSGYPPAYGAALVASTAVLGPIIPPSITMVLYAVQDQSVSVMGLFTAGILPGVLIAVALLGYNAFASWRGNYRGTDEKPTWSSVAVTTWRAIPALILPVVIIGGIRVGVFTATEASVVAVFYAAFCGFVVYRTLTIKMLPDILARSAYLSCAVLIIVGSSAGFAYALTVANVPQNLAAWIGSLGLGPIEFLIAVNILLLLFGIFIEPLPGVMILVPILAPMAAAMGINTTHFAMIVIVNLTLGMITPPVGGLLFVSALVGKVPIQDLTRAIWPLLALQILMLALITFVPWFSLALL